MKSQIIITEWLIAPTAYPSKTNTFNILYTLVQQVWLSWRFGVE